MGSYSLRGRERIYYGWFILFAAFVAVFLANGFRMAFGVFMKPMLEEFQWSRATISLAVGINTVLHGILQPFAGRFADRYGSRNITVVGLCILSLAAILLYFTPSLLYFYLIYGVLLALGVTSSALVIQSSLVSRWFTRRRGLALGIVSSGASAGQLILIPLTVSLIKGVGWRITDLFFGFLILLTAVPLTLFLIKDSPAQMGLSGEAPPAGSGSRKQPRVSPAADTLLPVSFVLKTSPFLLLSGGFFVCGYTTGIVQTHLAAYATDLGFSASDAARLLAVMGGMNIFGTLLMGAISDKTGRKLPLALMYFLRGIALLAIIFSHNLTVLYGFSIFMGFSWFATVPLTSGLTGDIYGARNIGTLVGLMFLSHQVGSSISSYLGGLVFDLTGAYDLAFLSAALMGMAGALASYMIQENARFFPAQVPQQVYESS